MEKLTEVLEMGGYAAYVWPAFLIGGVVMLGMAVGSLRSLRKAQKTLAELQNTSPNEA